MKNDPDYSWSAIRYTIAACLLAVGVGGCGALFNARLDIKQHNEPDRADLDRLSNSIVALHSNLIFHIGADVISSFTQETFNTHIQHRLEQNERVLVELMAGRNTNFTATDRARPTNGVYHLEWLDREFPLHR